jgi:hypothetical protein
MRHVLPGAGPNHMRPKVVGNGRRSYRGLAHVKDDCLQDLQGKCGRLGQQYPLLHTRG